MGGEYYDLLGVSADASAEEIAAAYRKRLKETHPDVSDASDASERTKRLIEAKEVLTDDAERARYDRLGHDRYVRIEHGEETDPHEKTDPHQETTGTTDRTRGQRATGGTDGPTAGKNRTRRAGRGATPGEQWAEPGWEAVSEAVWEEVTKGTGHAGMGAYNTGGRGASGRNDTASGQTSTDGRTVGWYHGGDPGGSSHNAWSFGDSAARESRWRSWTSGTSTSRHSPGTATPNRLLSPLQEVVLLCLSLLTYPVLVFGAVGPMFSPAGRLTLAVVLVFVVSLLLVLPRLGVVVFGAWTPLFPVVLVNLGTPLLAVESLLVLVITLTSLVLAVLSRLLVQSPI